MSNYRTGVLNDFSIVSKAKFYILKPTTGYPKYELKETLPVQINPTEFNLNCISKTATMSTTPVNFFGQGTEKVEIKSIDIPREVSIPLKFDIYDEYNVRTLDGVDVLTSNISLMNEKLTSLPKLIKYWGDNDHYAFFKWGEIEYFGLISEVSCSYSAFSRWGEPLKGDATITIREQLLSDQKVNSRISTLLGTIGTLIKTEENAKQKVQVGLLAASKALR